MTGAAHGIGEAAARMFAAEGAQVGLVDRDRDALAKVTREIEAGGGAAEGIVADVSVPDDLRRMVEAAVERFGGLDILVNNAGLTGFERSVLDEDMEARYDLLMATNLKSVWMALHYAVPHMKQRGGGSVVNISSVHGLASGGHNSAYAASKGAMIAGTRGLAVELAPDHIRVNCISPGMIWKDDQGGWFRRELGPALYQEFEERFGDWLAVRRTLPQPLPVAGLPIDIAYCATYLASDEARFCTGANFVVDGGATALLANPSHSPAAEHREREKEVRAWLAEARQRKG